MSDHQTVVVVNGTPAPQELRAIEAAIEHILRLERAKADVRPDPWLLSARAAAAQRGAAGVAGSPDAWRLSGQLTTPPPSPLQPGRGDAR